MTDILLVDASAERQRNIRNSFQTHADWSLLVAASPAEGRAAFQQEMIDLVILDLDSAGPPGEELFDWIRADQSRIPVVLLTSENLAEQSHVEALVMGAASYVPLSSVARDLVVTVERLLGLSGCHRRHARLSEGLISTVTEFRLDNNDLSLIGVLIGHLIDTADEFGVATAKNRMQIAVALEEAITNGIVHGNLRVPSALKDEDSLAFGNLVQQRCTDPEYAGRKLFVSGEFEQGFCRITITDEGEGFDPARVHDPTQPENRDKPHGRGLFLIRAFMDEVSFNETGNQIQLTKRSPQQSIVPSLVGDPPD